MISSHAHSAALPPLRGSHQPFLNLPAHGKTGKRGTKQQFSLWPLPPKGGTTNGREPGGKPLIEQAIYLIRGQKVMLDRDLAALYGVTTKALKQAVRRNLKRFPEDFMFVLDDEEFADWRSQFVTSNSDRMGLRYPPMAFTEQGVAMLSGILNSDRAIEVNIRRSRSASTLRSAARSMAPAGRSFAYDEHRSLIGESRTLAEYPEFDSLLPI